MSQQLIISVGREFGSGGHEIAENLSKIFEIPLYDRRLLEEIAKEKGIDIGILEKYDEKPKKALLSRTVRGHSNSVEEILTEMQFDYLKKKAASGESFVVVGRCSELILKDNPNMVSVFVLADFNKKVERVKRIYHLSEGEAILKMRRHDKARKASHNPHSKYHWGDSRNYDICVNSSTLGVEETTRLLAHFVRSYFHLEHPIEY